MWRIEIRVGSGRFFHFGGGCKPPLEFQTKEEAEKRAEVVNLTYGNGRELGVNVRVVLS